MLGKSSFIKKYPWLFGLLPRVHGRGLWMFKFKGSFLSAPVDAAVCFETNPGCWLPIDSAAVTWFPLNISVVWLLQLHWFILLGVAKRVLCHFLLHWPFKSSRLCIRNSFFLFFLPCGSWYFLLCKVRLAGCQFQVSDYGHLLLGDLACVAQSRDLLQLPQQLQFLAVVDRWRICHYNYLLDGLVSKMYFCFACAILNVWSPVMLSLFTEDLRTATNSFLVNPPFTQNQVSLSSEGLIPRKVGLNLCTWTHQLISLFCKFCAKTKQFLLPSDATVCACLCP